MLRKKHEGRVIWRLATWDQDWHAWVISGLQYCQDGRLSLEALYRHGFVPCPNRDMFQNPRWTGKIVYYGNFVGVHPSYSAKIVIDELGTTPVEELLQGIKDGLGWTEQWTPKEPPGT